jgi:flagella basal body P-ring formation protein FlgA
MMPLATFALGACLAVGAGSDQVVAGDLAASAPEWAAIPPETPLGLAPAPGVQRVFRLPELRHLALRWKLAAQPERDLCVTRPVAMPDPADLLTAMHRQLPDAHIEIVEFGRIPAPQGELEFPLTGLRQTSTGGFWTGSIKYAGQHRFVLWARVKVTVSVVRVVAKEAIAPGRTLDPTLVRVEPREEFPSAGYLVDVNDVAGKMARRSIAAGAPLRTEWLAAAKVINRGDAVQVEIVTGAAHLKLDGVAASSGAVGETILVVNPDSKRQFRARVLSEGKVLVTGGNS